MDELMNKKILHITTSIPPKVDGVSDYSDKIARAINNYTDIKHEHLVIGVGISSSYGESFCKDNMKFVSLKSSMRDLYREIIKFAPHFIILHYVGYGYQKKGVPFWLLMVVFFAKNKIKKIKLLTVFHELYAMALPWKSAFWLSPFQRLIALSFAKISDQHLTNRDISKSWLEKYTSRPVEYLPVFSNVGEINSISDMRQNVLVVFGSESLRLKAYQTVGCKLFEWASRNNINIHDVGPAISDQVVSSLLRQHAVICHGVISDSNISSLLTNSCFGLIAYDRSYITKSGVFAAYCAHGVIPIFLDELNKSLVLDGIEVSILLDDSFHKEDLSSIRRNAWTWYQDHNLSAHSKIVINLLSLT